MSVWNQAFLASKLKVGRDWGGGSSPWTRPTPEVESSYEQNGEVKQNEACPQKSDKASSRVKQQKRNEHQELIL